MAAFPAVLVLFLYINLISGYSLLRDDDENEIIWPSEYHFKGEKLNFKTSLKEPFEMWYSAELNRSRIDFYGGSQKKYYYGDTGYGYGIHPVYYEGASEMKCFSYSLDYEQIDFLPDVSDLTYTGQTMTLYDKVVDVWTGSEEYQEKMIHETTLYVFKTDSGVDLPVQKITKSYNLIVGEISSHLITNYYDFSDEITEDELTVEDEDECEEFGLGKDFKKDLKMFHPDIPLELDTAFDLYTNHHSKQYHEKEHQKRKMIFEKNWRMVEEHNRKNLGFRLEVNEFSDMTEEELKFLSGTFPSKHVVPEMQLFPHTLSEIDEIVKDLPESFDLRMEGAVNPVKNQGHCGSCWAFCTTAAVEGAIARVNGERLLDLSEQSLVDCAWEYENLGCNGGTLDGALKYVMTYGIPTEMDYGLYTAYDGYCTIQNMTDPYKIRGFAQVTPRNPSALKVALYKYGPVTVAIHASVDMYHYSSGLFYDFSCEDTHPNHGVTVVGYGVRDDEEYWIVKNSWGEDWGEDGYILMSARNNNCYLLDSPFYPIV